MGMHVESQEAFPRILLFPGEPLVARLPNRVVIQQDENSLLQFTLAVSPIYGLISTHARFLEKLVLNNLCIELMLISWSARNPAQPNDLLSGW